MCACRNAKAPNCKENSKVDPRHSPKTKGCPAELTDLGEPSTDEPKVLTGTEQGR